MSHKTKITVLQCPDCGRQIARTIVPKRDEEPEYWVFDCKNCGYYRWIPQRES